MTDNWKKRLKEPVQELATVRDCLRWATSLMYEYEVFPGHGYGSPWDEAVALVLHAIHFPWDTDNRIQDAQLTSRERQAIADLIGARVRDRKPAAYLIGQAWFAGMPFQVDERVLIPRSPIAELIENGFSPWLQPESIQRVLDVCTGSGCIGMACAEYLPHAEVHCSDISSEALEVAEANRQALALQDQVTLFESDLFAGLPAGKYDLIVSNPPYVDQADIDSMPPEFEHEPRLGLAAGDDGLALVRRMLPVLADRLNEGGMAIIEVGNSCEALDEAYPEVPFTWLEFERGGHGVFAISYDEALAYQPVFASRAQ